MPVVVAIVGRPNVGKSTLFNRLVGRKQALVDDRPGVTRDRREGQGRIGDLRFTVIDTAGLDDTGGDGVETLMQEQTARAIADADVALLLIDSRAGITPLDRQFANRLRRGATPVILVANKCEGRSGEGGRLEGYGLGLGEPIPLSAEHGEGLADLYDALRPHVDRAAGGGDEAGAETVTGTADATDAMPPATPIRLAVVGRPNVGKSTLVNRLLGEERMVTSPEPGTTRDAITVAWTCNDRDFHLVDTAGLRRRSRIFDRVEQLAAADSWHAVRFAQVVVVVIDAAVGLDKQDLAIARTVVDEGRALVVAVNKIDLVRDRPRTLSAARERLDESLAQVRGVRVAAVSALTGTGLADLMAAVTSSFDVWTRRVATPPLNRWLAAAVERHPPPAVRGRRLKLRYITQVAQRPPTFTVFAGGGETLPEEYVRYLVNGLRETFDLPGVPIRLAVRSARNPFAPRPAGVRGR